MNTTTDRIERKILLKAPRQRVWQALHNIEEFGNWFGVKLHGKTFEAGQRVHGNITYPGYEHLSFEVWVERVEPPRLLSWRWHPAAIEPEVDYSSEPTTLVVFELQEVDGATLVSVVESGFDAIPAGRRLDAFRMNGDGWTEQMKNIEQHVATS